jgi:DNA-binding MarR family transcriptional regulator
MKCQFNFDMHLVFAMMNGRVSAAINRNLYRNFRANGIDISPEQWTVLLYLWEKDGVTQQELCNATYKDKPSMTRLINNMEHRDLVRRDANDNDKRVNLIHLTEKGKGLEVRMRIITSRTLKNAFNGIANEDIDTCQKVLRQIFENTQDEASK